MKRRRPARERPPPLRLRPERALQRQARSFFTDCGYIVIKLTTLGPYGNIGWPDLLVLKPGAKVTFVEVKAPNGKVTELQAQRHRELRALGFEVLVLRAASELEGL